MSIRRWRPAAVAAALLLGVAVPVAEARDERGAYRPQVVVGLADTGINPYHQAFYRPQNTAHPCTWVKGFTDCSLPALNLSIGKYDDHAAAVKADAAAWASVEEHSWYWIPRTNIIGAVCDSERGGGADGRAVKPDATCILDDEGHGTATASSVLSEAPDALLLVHDGISNAKHMRTAPVAPDVRSHSWGPPVPVPLQAAGTATGECLTPGRTEKLSLFFLAAGNRAPFPSLLDCGRHHPDVQVVGGGYPGYWDYDSWSVYDFASWMCRPVARHDSIHDLDPHGCGTSYAAPTAAGTAAAALLRLRRQDGYAGRNTASHVSPSITRERFLTALREGASYSPEAKFERPDPAGCLYVGCLVERPPVGWAPLPEQAPYLFWGYGWLDSTVTDAVVACARGRACAGKSTEAAQYNAMRQDLRSAQAGLAARPPQDDASSGRDAGAETSTAVPVRPGRSYHGSVDPLFEFHDVEDRFTFRGRAGQRVTLAATSTAEPLPAEAEPHLGCWRLLDTEGNRLSERSPGVELDSYGCARGNPNAPPEDVALPATGTYVLSYTAHNGLPPHSYDFTLSVR